jgi:hypothetical protein
MAMDAIENNCVAAKFVNRKYDNTFRDGGAKQGDTYNIRIPGYGTFRRGKVANPQGYADTFIPVTLAQGGADMQFSSKELALNVDDFQQNVLAPQLAAVWNQIDSDILALTEQVNNAVGTPGTAMTDLQSFLDAGAILDENGVPRDGNWSAIMSPRTQASIVGGLKTLFNPQSDIAEQYKNGTMGRLAAGYKFSMDQNVPTHTFGPLGGSPTYTSGATDGGNTMVTGGWTAAAAARLNAGDIFTVAGVYRVNPVSKIAQPDLMTFRVVSAFSSDASGNGTVTFDPPMRTTGTLQNVSALPAGSAVITPLSAASKVSANNIVFHQDAFVLACVDLPKVGQECTRIFSKKLGISARLAKFWNGTQDEELYRLDVLYGVAKLREGFACRVHGA